MRVRSLAGALGEAAAAGDDHGLAVDDDGVDADRAELVAADRAAAAGEEELVWRAFLERRADVAADAGAAGEHEAAVLADAAVGTALDGAAHGGVAELGLVERP
jgi:hypothetical protein